jgi:hypothetical protein
LMMRTRYGVSCAERAAERKLSAAVVLAPRCS